MVVAKTATGKLAGVWVLRLNMHIQATSFLAFNVVIVKFLQAVVRGGFTEKCKRIWWTLYASLVMISTRSFHHTICE